MSFITSWVKVMAEQITMDAFLAERKESTQKRIKKQGPYQLPENWSWAKLGDICKINPSKREIKDLPDNIKVTFVPMAAVSEITGEIEKPEIRLLGEVRKGYTYFREGDVLFAKITPCMENGKSAIAKGLVNGLGFGSTEFHVLRPLGEVIPEWIHYYIRQESFREEAARSMMGSVGQQRVPKQFLVNAMIPLPPIHEQKRIVARLEELVSRAEEAKRLRRIAKEKTEKIMQAALYKVFSRAKKEGWEWAKLGNENIAEIIMGQSPPSTTYNKEGKGLPFYQGKADFGELYPTPRIWCSKPNKIAEQGDLLISVRAPVGPVNLCRERSCIGRGLAAIRPRKHILNSFFLFYYLRSIENTWIGKGSTFKAIKKRDLQNLEIPLPPFEEQKRLASYLDQVREAVDYLKRAQQRTEEQFEILVPAILAKAFKGGL